MVNIQFRKGRSRVPVLSSDEIDIFAEAILDDFRPELLESPCAVPIDEIVKTYFNLSVDNANLSNDNTFSGMVAFTSGKLELFDNFMLPMVSDIKEGTILLDNSLMEPHQERRLRFALGHELGHWIFHKHKFAKQDFHSSSDGDQPAVVYKCQGRDIGRVFSNSEIEADVEWMEWHADCFSLALLMPKPCVLSCINEGLKKSGITEYEIYKRGDKLSSVLQMIVDGISMIFNVARKDASIRLCNLGYMTEEIQSGIDISECRSATGVPYHRKVRSSKKTYSISFHEAMKLFSSNPDFQRVIRTGAYLNIGNNFCLNDPKYVHENTEGSPELTEYARQHMDECCLAFTQEEVQYRLPSNGNMAYHVPSKTEVDYKNSKTDFLLETKELADIQIMLPATFSGTLRAHMLRAKTTEDDLAERMQVNQKTIQRLLNEPDKQPRMELVVAVCIALKLRPLLSFDLIRKSGNDFMPGNLAHVAYQTLLLTKFQSTVGDCNAILEESALKPLG